MFVKALQPWDFVIKCPTVFSYLEICIRKYIKKKIQYLHLKTCWMNKPRQCIISAVNALTEQIEHCKEEPCRRYALYVPTHGRGQATYPMYRSFLGCREWSEPRCNCLISCRSLCLEKMCQMNEMSKWMKANSYS